VSTFHGGAAAVRSVSRIVTLRLAAGALALLLAMLLALPLAAQTRVIRRNVATLPFEDGLIVVDAHSDGKVVIGASHGDSTSATPLPAATVKEWADSTARLLARRVPRSSKPRVYRSSMVNPETGAGVSFTRRVTRGKSTYRLFFANARYGGFPFELSKGEGELLVHSLRKAEKTARALSASPPARRRRR
jgi:hypothetical protein